MIESLRKKAHTLLSGDGLRARLVRGGLGSVAIQALSRVLALALGVVLARVLGAEDYGIYAYSFAIMSLLMVVAEAGVPTLLMREVAASQAREDWGLLVGALRRAGQFVALTSVSVSLVGLLILVLVADRFDPTVVYTTALMLLVLPVTALGKTVAHAMRGLQWVMVGQVLDMLLRPIFVLFFVAVAFMSSPGMREPHYAMAAQLAAGLIVLFAGVLALRLVLTDDAADVKPSFRSRDWLRSALPFTLIGGAGIINNNADIIMLGWFSDSQDVGIYRVAVQGATLVAFGLQAANAVVAPQFARLHAQGDMVRLQRLVTLSARVTLFAALPIALAFVLAGGVIVGWVFGLEFEDAHIPLAILAIGQLVNAGFGSVGFLLNMTGHEGHAARALWQTAILNMLMNLMLIPQYGMIGAAAASSVSLLVWNVLMYRRVRKHLNLISTALKV